jgi:hypothetical protein
MKRITAIATALLVPTLLAGCEDDDDDIFGLEDCATLTGNFRATNFGVTGTTNTSLVRDFDRAGAQFTLNLRNNGSFESRFGESGRDPLVRTGNFTATGNELRLGNQGLFRGASNVDQRFTCERLDANRFRLRNASAARFDFDEDETFEEGEEGIFEGDFELF